MTALNGVAFMSNLVSHVHKSPLRIMASWFGIKLRLCRLVTAHLGVTRSYRVTFFSSFQRMMMMMIKHMFENMGQCNDELGAGLSGFFKRNQVYTSYVCYLPR